MSATELADLVNKTCLVPLGSAKVRCLIDDARNQYGNDRVLLRPISGAGTTWVNLANVTLLKEGQ